MESRKMVLMNLFVGQIKRTDVSRVGEGEGEMN